MAKAAAGPQRVVCYLANAAAPNALRWAEHFARKGDDVHLITLDRPDGPVDRVSVHVLDPPRWARGASRYMAVAARTRRLVRVIDPDIVHAHYVAGYGLLAALVNRHPMVLSMWGTDVLGVPQRSAVHRGLIRWILSRGDYLCSTSSFMAERARALTSGPIRVTPFGVDCCAIRPSARERSAGDTPVIGMVKRLTAGSGVGTLLEARALLEHQLGAPKPRLVLAGPFERRTDWPGRARELGISHCVEFAGPVPRHEVARVLERLDLFIAPSTHVESFGVAVLEAQAAGLPVIASRIGGLPEVLLEGVTGLLVEPGDAAALAEAIAQLLDDYPSIQAMGRAAREFVCRSYNWQHSAQPMEELYDRIADDDGPPAALHPESC